MSRAFSGHPEIDNRDDEFNDTSTESQQRSDMNKKQTSSKRGVTYHNVIEIIDKLDKQISVLGFATTIIDQSVSGKTLDGALFVLSDIESGLQELSQYVNSLAGRFPEKAVADRMLESARSRRHPYAQT